MRITLFGRTFHPIHNAHLENPRFVIEQYRLDKLLFIPAKFPVHKQLVNNSGAYYRVRRLGDQQNKTLLCSLERILVSVNELLNFSSTEIRLRLQQKKIAPRWYLNKY